LLLTIVVALSVIALVPIVGGCSSEDRTLNGTSWRLSEWTLSSLDPADFTITAQFADGTVSGSSGVNLYSGPAKLGPGDAFSVGQVSATEMAGDEAAMRAESAYLTLLRAAESYKTADGKLTLFDGGGNESLIFEAAESQDASDAATGIAAVKDRHETELMAVPGVVGVGIGEQDGSEVIVVFVEKKDAATESRIPKTLEGYSLRVEVTGPITAQ